MTSVSALDKLQLIKGLERCNFPIFGATYHSEMIYIILQL